MLQLWQQAKPTTQLQQMAPHDDVLNNTATIAIHCQFASKGIYQTHWDWFLGTCCRELSRIPIVLLEC